MNRKGVILALVVLVVIIAILFFSFLLVLPSEYTRLEIPLGGHCSYLDNRTNTGSNYAFGCLLGWNSPIFQPFVNNTSLFGVESSYNDNIQYFHLTVGATFTVGSSSSYYGGVEIKVSEIHSDYIVLLVKPL